jgi:hypothetical protein
MDDRIDRVVLYDPPASHWQGPALLNVLRVTDIPEVAGAFAPRELVVVGGRTEQFPPSVQKIYELNGARDRFIAANSLPDALRIWEH